MNRFQAFGVSVAIIFSIMGCNRIESTNPASAPAAPLAKDALASVRTYTTNFPNTENPVSEGGNWINGATTGIDWGNVSTTPGQTHPHPGPARYADATALLTGTWGADQSAQGTVYINNAYNYPEVELRLRSTITPHVCNGYEVSFSLPPNNYLLIVRWNGPLGNYTILQWPTGSQYQVKTGDVVKATIVGNVITAYKNGVQLAQATDNTYTSGNPGMGFNEQDNGDYGYTSFSASEIVSGNTPPTVASAAAASPNPVTGTTTALSVLGADDGGEAGLTYTWSTTSTPSGGSASFSANGNNAAKNTTATFTKAGVYTLQASIADAQGQVVTSSVSVTINQTFTSIGVTPSSASVVPNGTQQFSATAKDQFGSALISQPAFTWSVSGGGTINAGGLFTAGTTTGGPFTVTATSTPKSGTASVTISAVLPVTYQINSGAGAVSPFAADQFFSGGNTYSTGATITTAGVANAAPAAVYQTERFGNFSYTIGSLAAGSACTVRLHFAEIYQTAAGMRLFNVSINGTPVLTNFDIFATAGGANKALVREFSANANASGQIVIQYTNVVDNAKSSAIEVISNGGQTNQAPTVATPAAATPGTVTGSTTNLSVLGADDAGEANLIYTWATTGTPPAAVTFNSNGTNGAKNTTATFSKAGSYSFQVTIKDQGNLTVNSSINVTVNQTLTTVTVSPSSANVAVNATQQFTANAKDQFGNVLSTQPAFTWSVTGGGTINATGLFTAGSTAGGPFTVTGTSGGKSGTASVTVTAVNNPPTVATAASANPGTVTGSTTNLSVLGADDAGEANLIYTWATTGTPPTAVTFNSNGTNGAKNTTATFSKAGSYSFQVTIKDQGNLTITSSVNVTVNQALTTVTVSPSSASVAVNGTQQFTASAKDQFGIILTTQPSFTWSVTGGGTINTAGLFTAGSTAGGPFTATGTSGGKSGTASVTITSGQTALFRINAGGSAVSPFAADQYFSAGNTYSTGSTISTAGVTNPAPMAVYQTERFGNFTYTFTGLTAGASHTVRLHFAEIYQTAAGMRLFNVAINSTQVLTNFDIFAVAGGKNIAIVREFTAVADSTGKITIQFTTVADNAKVSGIEILKP